MKEEKYIWASELEELGAASLADWQQQEPFTPPASYFRDFTTRLKAELEDEVVIGRESLLSQARGVEPFQAPAGYFNDFDATIKRRIHAQTPQGSVVPLRSPWRVARIAAAILIMIMGIWLGFAPQIHTSLHDELSQDELIAFIETEGIDAYTVAEALGASSFDLETDFQLSPEEIDQLLDEHDIDQWDLESLIEDEI